MKELSLQNCRLDGRYDILRLLGRGSYAEIYLARDNSPADALHQFVVIKALNVLLQEEPDADLERTLVENFQNEALALDRVRHPNVLNRLGHGTARDLEGVIFHYLVLEYLPGGNLMEICKRQALSLEKTLFYLEQVCAGLQHAHDCGVIHRDIKPHNLLLTEDRKIVKIADFGVAKLASSDAPITRVGTNIYAAPEHSPLLATGNLNNPQSFRLTPAADVYSLAKTVYVLLSGVSPRQFANAPISALPPQISGQNWAKDILRILEKATQTNPEARFPSVKEFWREICAVKSDEDCDLPTNVLKRELTDANLAELAPKAPNRADFSSMPNVQMAPAAADLAERPRIVVELNKTEQQARVAEKTAAAPKPLETAYAVRFPVNNPANMSNGHAAPIAPANSAQPAPQVIIAEPPVRKPRKAGIVSRLMVSLLLLAIFGGVLYGTFIYLRNAGYIPSSVNVFTQQKGKVKMDAWLRSSPGMASNNQLGIVTTDSELNILGSDGNWYEVEIVRQGRQIKEGVANSSRGWIGKSVVDVQ